jgi:hypothetical protein
VPRGDAASVPADGIESRAAWGDVKSSGGCAAPAHVSRRPDGRHLRLVPNGAQTWDAFLYSPRRIIEHKWQDFLDDDDSGSALIRIGGAEVSLEEMRAAVGFEPAGAVGTSAGRHDRERAALPRPAHGFVLRYHPASKSSSNASLSEEPKEAGPAPSARGRPARGENRIAVHSAQAGARTRSRTAFSVGLEAAGRCAVVLGEPPRRRPSSMQTMRAPGFRFAVR